MAKAGDGDRRTTHTDALETLGTIIGPGEKRDAIHLAVEPVVAGEKLYPGQDVGLLHTGEASGHDAATKTGHVGIVDPFLKKPVMPGERFWLVIYPRQIHSLRHVWTHPAFPDVPEVVNEAPKLHASVSSVSKTATAANKKTSEKWLRDWCSKNDAPDYDMVIEIAHGLIAGEVTGPPDEIYGRRWEFNACGDDKYIVTLGTDAHARIPNEFWTHVETVIGRSIPEEYKATGFSCSC